MNNDRMIKNDMIKSQSKIFQSIMKTHIWENPFYWARVIFIWKKDNEYKMQVELMGLWFKHQNVLDCLQTVT